MTTAKQLSYALGEALGKAGSQMEAYGVALRKLGLWAPTKRGRGSAPMTDTDAASLLVAVLCGGPNELRAPFAEGLPLSGVRTLLNAMPDLSGGPYIARRFEVVRDILGLPDVARPNGIGAEKQAALADYVAEIIRLYRMGEIDRLVLAPDYPEGMLPEWEHAGPNVELRAFGPFPMASIAFVMSNDAIDKHARDEHEAKILSGVQRLIFVESGHAHLREAIAQGDQPAAEGWSGYLEVIRKATARGIRFERMLSGREFAAVAGALAGGDTGADEEAQS